MFPSEEEVGKIAELTHTHDVEFSDNEEKDEHPVFYSVDGGFPVKFLSEPTTSEAFMSFVEFLKRLHFHRGEFWNYALYPYIFGMDDEEFYNDGNDDL